MIQPIAQAQASPQKHQEDKEDEEKKSSSSSEEVDFDYDDSNQKFFNLADVKPLDFKAKWLGNTNELINKFQTKLSELHKDKVNIKEQFERFAQNENRFKISSLRKINFVLDKKKLYDEYMQKTRKTIQKLHPSLIINICSYVSENVFLALAKMRRVSKIYSAIYTNDGAIHFFSQKDFGKDNMGLQIQEKWCERYIAFKETFLYYKQIKYTVLIPQNSIKQDIEMSVDFINQVYKRAYLMKSTDFGYFDLINKFIHQHRLVLALEALTFTDMAVTKKASIVAFSNYLAFNPAARQKDQITKTKYLKMIQMVEDEHYRDSLLINSKLSAYLHDQHQEQFAVFIDTLKNNSHIGSSSSVFDLVIFHIHNQMKSSFSREVIITTDPIEIGEVTVQFQQQLLTCFLSYRMGNRLENESLMRQYLPTYVKGGKFGHCYIYRGQFYYVVLIKSPEQQQ